MESVAADFAIGEVASTPSVEEELMLTYIRVPAKDTQRLAKQLRKYLFRRPQFRPVQSDLDGSSVRPVPSSLAQNSRLDLPVSLQQTASLAPCHLGESSPVCKENSSGATLPAADIATAASPAPAPTVHSPPTFASAVAWTPSSSSASFRSRCSTETFVQTSSPTGRESTLIASIEEDNAEGAKAVADDGDAEDEQLERIVRADTPRRKTASPQLAPIASQYSSLSSSLPLASPSSPAYSASSLCISARPIISASPLPRGDLSCADAAAAAVLPPRACSPFSSSEQQFNVLLPDQGSCSRYASASAEGSDSSAAAATPTERAGQASAATESGLGSSPVQKNVKQCWRRIFFDESIKEDLQGLPDDLRSWLLSQAEVSVGRQNVQLSYANMTAEEVLRKNLPANVEVPRRFEVVGHIAHLNLKTEQLPYRFLIARVLLDKVPALRTVVSKTGIASQWRELQFEHLAGERSYVARLKENDMLFEIDYAKVYWNSRLAAEREKLTLAVPPGSVVLDLFAGVGAFSLFLTKRDCLVLANDGNPAALACMKKNIELNKLQKAHIITFNLDARDFVRKAVGSPEKLVQLLRYHAEVQLQKRMATAAAEAAATKAPTSSGSSEVSKPAIVAQSASSQQTGGEQTVRSAAAAAASGKTGATAVQAAIGGAAAPLAAAVISTAASGGRERSVAGYEAGSKRVRMDGQDSSISNAGAVPQDERACSAQMSAAIKGQGTFRCGAGSGKRTNIHQRDEPEETNNMLVEHSRTSQTCEISCVEDREDGKSESNQKFCEGEAAGVAGRGSEHSAIDIRRSDDTANLLRVVSSAKPSEKTTTETTSSRSMTAELDASGGSSTSRCTRENMCVSAEGPPRPEDTCCSKSERMHSETGRAAADGHFREKSCSRQEGVASLGKLAGRRSDEQEGPTKGSDGSREGNSYEKGEGEGDKEEGEFETYPFNIPTEIHYIMNLPELALDFLDVFRGLLVSPRTTSADAGSMENPGKMLAALKKVKHRVHCYGFSRSVPPEIDFKPRVEQALQHAWPGDAEVREVRDVAPNKRMYCVSFVVPETVLYHPSDVRKQ